MSKCSTKLISLFALTLLAAPACDKDKGEHSAAPSAKVSAEGAVAKTAAAAVAPTAAAVAPTAAVAVAPTAAAAAVATASSDASMYAHFPAKTEAVVHIDVANFTKSQIWKQFSPLLMAKAGTKYNEFKTACGFDPVTAIQSIYIGIDSASKEPSLIVKGVTRAQAEKCMVAFAKKEDKKITITNDGAFMTVTPTKTKITTTTGKTVSIEENDVSMIIAWKGDLAIAGKDKAAVTQQLAGTMGLDTNPLFTAMASKLNGAATITVATAFAKGSKMAQKLVMIGSPTGLHLSVSITDAISFDVGMQFANEKAATTSLGTIKGFLGMVKGNAGAAAPMIEKLEMAVAGAELSMKLGISPTDLQMMLPMLMQMK